MLSISKFGAIILLIFGAGIGAAQPVKKSDLIIGDEFFFQSNVLDHPVELFVGLPKNYSRSTCRYPVHYVLDGQILFTYYYGVMDILTKGEIPECIVVGIQSMKRGFYFKPGDGSGLFSEFIINELIPYIDKNYRTNTYRSILGHSTTGAFIIEMLLRHPEYIDLFIAGAPYHSEMIGPERLAVLPGNFTRKKYFYSFYGLEDNPAEKVNWDSLAANIRDKKIGNLKMVSLEYPEEGHYTIVFRYIPDGLKLAFSGWGYAPEPGEAFSFSAFCAHENYQKSQYNESFCYSEGYFISNSIGLSQEGDPDSAIQLLTFGLDYYPESDIIHNVLATQFENIGKTEKAIEHYKKALEINPGLVFIRKKIADLE